MTQTCTDRIEKQIELKAPVSRVWRALTDYREFGAWFQVNLEGPFVPGDETRGQITYAGCEHMVLKLIVQKMEPEHLFTYTWCPCDIDPNVDTSREPATLVEFRLEPSGNGTLLRMTESGFDGISQERRDTAYRRNEGGWTEQMKHIEAYVTKNP